ncbi:MAG: (4Fe-4S)-binding protein [Proteobacteria bacterium]|nr:(4Fe-4S)-binding protein [Pseudomonadota bacterium]
MKYERLTCYFLSGTGNSYRAAKWMAEAAAENGATTELVPIADARPREDLESGPGQLVGIYHPTHGLMPPWSMIKFLFRMPWGHGTHAVIVATRGGIPLKPLVIPGGAGLALFFPLLILLLKGYRIQGGVGIDMPANMLNLHWGLHKKNTDHIVAWGKGRHQRLVDAVLAGKRYWHPINVLWELVWCIPFVLWPIFPVAYLLVGRVFMAKLMFADTSCRGCGKCARNCPCQAIAMVGTKPKTPFWTHHCEVCMRCMGYCKFHAIQASHLWMVPVAYGTSFLTASLIQELFATLFGRQLSLIDPAEELIAILLTFLSLPLIYYVFFGLQRFRPLRIFFTYTTLTKLYPRRYHAPETTAREMTRRSEIKEKRKTEET